MTTKPTKKPAAKAAPKKTAQAKATAKKTAQTTKPKAVKPEVKPVPVETDEERAFRAALENLEPRQRDFVRHYLSEPNATKAAIKAGYSEKTARQMGSENLSKPDIADAVELGFQRVMGKHEVRARTAEVAAGSMEDFLSIERVPYLDPVVVEAEEALDLIEDKIADLSEELDSANEERADWITKEIRRLRRQERKCEREIARAERARENADDESRKPKDRGTPTVFLELEWQERVVVRVDFEKARDAGKLHLLKKVKETKFGMEIELYDAAEARTLLGKHYKLWGDKLALENPDGTPIKFIVGVPEGAL